MKTLKQVPFALWDQVAKECPYATFFHTSLWARILQKTHPTKYKIGTRAFEIEPGEWAVLPMMEGPDDLQGFFRSFYSNVPGVYGGFLYRDVLSKEKIELLLQNLPDIRSSRFILFGNPFADVDLSIPTWTKESQFTHVLDLENFSSEEDLLTHYTHNVRNSIHRAKRVGYTCAPAESENDVRDYYHIYQQALGRYGETATGRQELDLFLNIWRDGAEKASLWLAKTKEQVMGGVQCFFHNKHWVAWHAAFLEDTFEHGLPKYLHHQIICHAKKEGFKVYDFNPSGGHQGTILFKERFHAARLSFNSVQWANNRWHELYRRVLHA